MNDRLITARTIYEPHSFSYMEEIKVRLEKQVYKGSICATGKPIDNRT